jgi:hypothetical protein
MPHFDREPFGIAQYGSNQRAVLLRHYWKAIPHDE